MTRKPEATTRRRVLAVAGSAAVAGFAGCTGDDTTGEEQNDDMDDGEMDDGEMDDGGDMDDGMEPTDPEEAPRTDIDRFSEDAGTLHVRGDDGDLPGPDEPIDFDERFLVAGFGPDGQDVQYYDFDVMSTTPAPIYAFFRENGDPVEDQLNLVDVVPGDDGYNDFWQVNRVTVPDEYQANTITSVDELFEADYDIEATDTVKNCPVVPDGSTASRRHGSDDGTTDLVEGWYDGEVVYYMVFQESALELDDGSVPLSPIYVSFNTNPGEDGGGPPSGFMTEADTDRTHNVTATAPSDEAYSPLWSVNIYDNGDFGSVSDLESALDAEVLAAGAAQVNCPVVGEE